MPTTVLTTDITGLKPFIKGKVRDVYDLDDALLLITTDRISAFDCVLPTAIPDKGKVLNLLSAFWFDHIREFCPNHLITTELGPIMQTIGTRGGTVSPDVIEGRTTLARKVQALPVECVVRGYLEGSGWKEYLKTGSVCGIALPEGLQQGSRLPEPIFTPSTKAHTGHDENITHEQMAELLPREQMDACVNLSLEVYNRAAEYALERDIIIADTKFEFGWDGEQVLMIDECLTPDSSRFWDAERWQPGGPQPSFDKQFVRDYLDSIGWNHDPPAPALPADVAEKTADKYREIYQRLTGSPLPGA